MIRGARRASEFCLLVSVITGAHHRSGLDMAETEAESLASQMGELLGRVETRDRQMILRGAQVLAYGEDIDAACTQIAEDFNEFFG